MLYVSSSKQSVGLNFAQSLGGLLLAISVMSCTTSGEYYTSKSQSGSFGSTTEISEKITYKNISAGERTTCTIGSDRRVYCVGSNEHVFQGGAATALGLLGNRYFGGDESSTPLVVTLENGNPLEDVYSIASTKFATCALANVPGELDHIFGVYCWGSNEYGQLGIGSAGSYGLVRSYAGPVMANAIETFKGSDMKIAAGRDHFCASMGPVVSCWGYNETEQVGADIIGGSPDPNSKIDYAYSVMFSTPPGGDSFGNVIELALGAKHSCALVNYNVPDGFGAYISETRTLCWGSNYNGTLGANLISTPTAMYDVAQFVVKPIGGGLFTPLAGMTQIQSATDSACALASGTLLIYCWGNNLEGQLGVPSTTDPGPPAGAIANSIVANLVPTIGSSPLSYGGGLYSGSNTKIMCLSVRETTAIQVYCFGVFSGNILATIHEPAGKKFISPTHTDPGVQTQYHPVGPVNVSALTPWLGTDGLNLVFGRYHGCILSYIGAVRCWGDNFGSRLGGGAEFAYDNGLGFVSTDATTTNYINFSDVP